MLWVGLTGGIASGKSTVAEIIRRQAGHPVVSADHLAHLAMEPETEGAKQIRKRFGDQVFDQGARVDRKQLGNLIFADPSGKSRRDLESILHPVVRRLAQTERENLKAKGNTIAFYEIPLLFEKNLQDQFDLVVCVAIDPKLQLARLIQRTGLSEADAKARIQAQLPQEEKIRQSDFVIWNNADLADLESATLKLVHQLASK